MKIHFTNKQNDLRVAQRRIEEAVELLASFKKVKCEEISIHLVTKGKIASLHKEYFQDPSPTDCITFPIDSPKQGGPGTILGEIFICPRVAIEYAKKHGTEAREEFFLYLVHGFLHLLGYDDIDPIKRRTMRRWERLCMRKIWSAPTRRSASSARLVAALHKELKSLLPLL